MLEHPTDCNCSFQSVFALQSQHLPKSSTDQPRSIYTASHAAKRQQHCNCFVYLWVPLANGRQNVWSKTEILLFVDDRLFPCPSGVIPSRPRIEIKWKYMICDSKEDARMERRHCRSWHSFETSWRIGNWLSTSAVLFTSFTYVPINLSRSSLFLSHFSVFSFQLAPYSSEFPSVFHSLCVRGKFDATTLVLQTHLLFFVRPFVPVFSFRVQSM